ncbi:MAG: hypothetical protein DWQ09_13285 [Proteobacteria bacterium]|nr:MAG: hypothetical protein DWQ09_13285 [Pseudomonadota bacterium]QKK12504.1 MAG: hypothetical protein HND59_13850 [Pseudomonadota bacterium]
MKTPRKTKQWAAEAFDALTVAWRLAAAEQNDLTLDAKQHLYKFAPLFCARNRGIRDKEQMRKIAHYCFGRRLAAIQQEPERVDRYAVNFLIAYLDAHVALDLLTAQRAAEVVRYLVDNYEIA